MGVLHEAFRTDEERLADLDLESGPEASGLPTAVAVGIIELHGLEAVLAGEAFRATSVPEPIEESEGAWLFALPARLLQLLAEIDPVDAPGVSRRWAATDEDYGWVGDEAERIVIGLRGLAIQALEGGQRLFLWTSL